MLLNILVGISEVLKKKKRKEKEQKKRGGQQKMWRSEMHIRGSFKKSERKQKKNKKTSSFIFRGLENAHDFIFCDYMPKAAHWSLTDYMKTVCLFSGKQKKKNTKKKR